MSAYASYPPEMRARLRKLEARVLAQRGFRQIVNGTGELSRVFDALSSDSPGPVDADEFVPLVRRVLRKAKRMELDVELDRHVAEPLTSAQKENLFRLFQVSQGYKTLQPFATPPLARRADPLAIQITPPPQSAAPPFRFAPAATIPGTVSLGQSRSEGARRLQALFEQYQSRGLAARMSRHSSRKHPAPHRNGFWQHGHKADGAWRASRHTGDAMHARCDPEAYEKEHDTTVKELVQAGTDKLPLGLSLLLRAAGPDLAKSADALKTRHGKVDLAGFVGLDKLKSKGTQARLRPSDEMHADLAPALDELQQRAPVWQRARLAKLRELLRPSSEESPQDVNAQAAELIARLGLLRIADTVHLSTHHAETLAAHLK